MAIEDNRIFNSNAEEIFLLQSMDGGGSGGGGGFNGKYLVIEGAINQKFGEPSISMGTDSYASGVNSIVAGVESVSGNSATYTFGNNNLNTAAGTMMVGTGNKSLASNAERYHINGNLIVGNNNELSELIYDNNEEEVNISGYQVGYLNDGYFYNCLDFIDDNKITFYNNYIYIDLLTIESETNYEGKYLYINDNLYSFSQLVNNLNYKISQSFNKGNIIVGEYNKLRSGSGQNTAWGNGIFGSSNEIKAYRNSDASCNNYLFGNSNKINTRGTYSKYNFLTGQGNQVNLNCSGGDNYYVYLFGQNNKLKNEKEGINDLNYAPYESYAIMMGRNNEITYKDSNISNYTLPQCKNVLIGDSNKIYMSKSYTYKNFLLGENNIIDTTNNINNTNSTISNYLLGDGNSIVYDSNYTPYSQYNYLLGSQISLNGTAQAQYNLFLGTNIGFGKHVGAYGNFIGGQYIDLVDQTYGSLILNGGYNYTFAALRNGMNIGEQNKIFGSYSTILGKNLQCGIDVTEIDFYDPSETYNTGDFCQYESYEDYLMKCKEDGVTGAWDSSKWDYVYPYSEDSKGLYNFIQGSDSVVLGEYNAMFGQGLVVNNVNNQLVIGKYNIPEDKAFIIGNGSNNDSRSNIFTIDKSGKIGFGPGAGNFLVQTNSYRAITIDANSYNNSILGGNNTITTSQENFISSFGHTVSNTTGSFISGSGNTITGGGGQTATGAGNFIETGTCNFVTNSGNNIKGGTNNSAEGGGNQCVTTSGSNNHLEGGGNHIYGAQSHVEGGGNRGYGSINNTHIEGGGNKAYNGENNHIEGAGCCIGNTSHSHVEGKYNISGIPYLKRNISTADPVAYIDTYDSSKTYEVGDYVTRPGASISLNGNTYTPEELYVCTTAVTSPEAFDSEKWTLTSANNALGCHAEGFETVSGAKGSHSEGYRTFAIGEASHASGSNTYALGNNSFTTGSFTKAQGNNQAVMGKYNAPDSSSLLIIGNGTGENVRSNALKLDASGNQILAGKLTVGTQPTTANDVATKQYVDTSTSNLEGIVAAQYDATASYTANQDYVIYNNELQLCNTNIAAGGEVWNATHWTEVKVADRLESIEGDVSTLQALAVDYQGATSGTAGVHGFVPAASTSERLKYLRGDGTWSMLELVEMSYGESGAWKKFIDAYNANCIVYCRASSSADPSSGSKTRKAFMAYVNNETTPTEVEFQYYRSVSSHSASAQGDEVYVYKLTKRSGSSTEGDWTVTKRNTYSKIVAGTNMTSSYSSGQITLNADTPTLSRPEYNLIATQDQTNFEIDTDYTNEPIDVYVGGIRKKQTDYTIVQGTNMKEVQFNTGLTAGEEVDITYIKLTMV